MSDWINPSTGEVIVSTNRTAPFIRTRYNYDMELHSLQSGLHCSDPTRAQQQFADECDINTIVRKFGVTGQLPYDGRVPLDEDFYDLTSYQDALHALMEADQAFMTLSSDVRKRFDNDPAKFVQFVSDPANKDEWTKLGLTRPVEAPQAPIEVRVIPDPSDPLKTAPEPVKAV